RRMLQYFRGRSRPVWKSSPPAFLLGSCPSHLRKSPVVSQCHLHLSPLAVESDIGRPLYARLVPVHLRVAAPIEERTAVDERLFHQTHAVVLQIREVDRLLESGLPMRMADNIHIGDDEVSETRHLQRLAALQRSAAAPVRDVDGVADSLAASRVLAQRDLEQHALGMVAIRKA